MTVHFIVDCCTSEILSDATATTGHYKGDAMYFFCFVEPLVLFIQPLK